MKIVFRSFCFFMSLICIWACSVEAKPSQTKKDVAYNNDVKKTDRVSLNEAIVMASRATKAGVTICHVDPILSNEGDTLMYFVNYEEGWKILSADKRTPCVIACGEKGSISLSTDNLSLLAWLDLVASDMKKVINSTDDLLTFSAEQIESHRNEWKVASNDFIEPSRGPGDLGPIVPFVDPHEWILVGTDTEEVYYDHVDHLVNAHWGQWYPYNYYCPPKDYGVGNKPVGCSPVACGQMLQFLSDLFGMPQSFSFNGVTGYMSDLYLPYTSTLIETSTPLLLRMIGDYLGAIYEDNNTTVVLAMPKIQNFYSWLGYTCNRQSYSTDKLKQNLNNGMPVLVSGYSGTILGIPDYSKGHTYIIDGYKRYRTQYTYYYERIYGDPPCYDYCSVVSYSSPYIGEIKMNWGWSSQWLSGTNDVWFALTGDWYVDLNSDGIPDENYTEDITMICDFDFNP